MHSDNLHDSQYRRNCSTYKKCRIYKPNSRAVGSHGGTDFTVSTSTGAPLINTSVPIRFTFDSQIKWHGFTTNLVLCPDLGQFLLVTTPQAFPVRQVNVMKPSKHTKT